MPSSRLLELENRVETTTSERDQLRTMLVSLQSELEQERLMGQAQQSEFRATQAQLKKMAKDLRSEQKQMDRPEREHFGQAHSSVWEIAAEVKAIDSKPTRE